MDGLGWWRVGRGLVDGEDTYDGIILNPFTTNYDEMCQITWHLLIDTKESVGRFVTAADGSIGLPKSLYQFASFLDNKHKFVGGMLLTMYIPLGHTFGITKYSIDVLKAISKLCCTSMNLVDVVALGNACRNFTIDVPPRYIHNHMMTPWDGEFDEDEPVWLSDGARQRILKRVERVAIEGCVWDHNWMTHRNKLRFGTFLLGQHKRVGAKSPTRILYEDVLSLIARFL